MRRELALPFLTQFQGRDRRLHVRPVFRESIEESRDEHVAGQAAERVEMNVHKTLPTPGSRRSQTPNIAFSPRRGHAISRRSRLGEGRRAEPASASYVVKAAALLRLKLTIDVACSINVRSDAPIIPTGSKEMLAGTSPRTVGQGRARA